MIITRKISFSDDGDKLHVWEPPEIMNDELTKGAWRDVNYFCEQHNCEFLMPFQPDPLRNPGKIIGIFRSREVVYLERPHDLPEMTMFGAKVDLHGN